MTKKTNKHERHMHLYTCSFRILPVPHMLGVVGCWSRICAPQARVVFIHQYCNAVIAWLFTSYKRDIVRSPPVFCECASMRCSTCYQPSAHDSEMLVGDCGGLGAREGKRDGTTCLDATFTSATQKIYSTLTVNVIVGRIANMLSIRKMFIGGLNWETTDRM
jgi:hypothetical protein